MSIEKMHVLITGGAGFIGSHTAGCLLQQGHRITVLDNLSSGKRENLPDSPDLRLVVGNINDPVAVTEAIQGCDRVLHLAAQVSVATSVEQPTPSCRDNILGFVNILDHARRSGITRMVYASSAAVYGQPAELPLNESSATAPSSPYGLEKLVNDQYATLATDLYGMQMLGMRYFNVYGPKQDPSSPYSGVISLFVDRLRRGKILNVHGDGGQTRDFVFVGDVARINAAALADSTEGVMNVGTGNSCTLLELIDVLAAIAGVEPTINHGPARQGDIRHSATAVERLRQTLAPFQFTPLREGLDELWKKG
jgi:UDP-glucose 4-epimerase